MTASLRTDENLWPQYIAGKTHYIDELEQNSKKPGTQQKLFYKEKIFCDLATD